MKRLFLIDGTALAYRAHFAFSMSSRGGLSTKDGRPTSAVYGFLTTLISLFEREQPDAVAISFDGAHKDLARTKVYPEYKSTRDKMPDELTTQLDLIDRAVKAYGIPVVRSVEHEADDVISTLAVRGRDAGMTVFIVTSDKDFMQIVGPKVKLWNLRASTRAPDVIGPAEVEAKFGVKPTQMGDLLALMGDTSDNIPGVPKVGAKTAAQLLVEFDDLDSLLARSEEVQRPAIRASLQQHEEQARLSRQLVELRTDVDLGIAVEDLGPPKPDREALEALFRELEFESLLKSLPSEAAPELPTEYRTATTDKQREALLARLRQAGHAALHLETSGSDPHRLRLLGCAFSTAPGQGDYVPVDRPADLEPLRALLEDAAFGLTVHDAKLARTTLAGAGVTLRGDDFDVMLASYCTAPNQTSHGLEALQLRHFAHKRAAKEGAGAKNRQKQKTFADIDPDVIGQQAAGDADYVLRLRQHLEPLVEELEVGAILRDLEMPLVDVLRAMEAAGIAIDTDHLGQLSVDMERRCKTLEEQVYALVGEPFNLNSPAQVGEAFFDKLELHKLAGGKAKPPKRTRTGQYKTDAAILEQLAELHEAPRLLLQYRQLTKLKGTYVDSLPKLVRADTGRVHTSFNQAVAATGRLSSDNPNLQNIPIRTEEGRQVRRAFVSRGDGWVLLSADYSQIELRILAHMSGDPTLIESFRNDEDIHARTAALVHGLSPDGVTSELRTQAKAINYGLMYGMGASRLARETGMTPPEAKRFIKAYFAALPDVKRLLDANLEHARQHREVRTLFGRRRPLPEIDSTNAMQRVAAENMAVNTPIQGTAADIVKRAMLEVHRRLAAEGLQAKLLLQVHDELLLDVPEGELDAAQKLLREAMAGAADLAVPLDVSMGSGRTWLDAH